MNCFFHETMSAVSTCQNCGKGLCKECASKYTPCRCDECVTLNNFAYEQEVKQQKAAARNDTIKELIICAVKGLISSAIFTFIFYKLAGSSTPIHFGMSIMFFFVPFGWVMITYMEQWLPAFFMSGSAFAFYIIFKLAFSVLLGIPSFVYQISRCVFNLICIAKVK